MLKACYEENKVFEAKYKQLFSDSEDAEVIKLVSLYGKNWNKINEFMPERSPIALRNRFYALTYKKSKLQKIYKTQELKKCRTFKKDAPQMNEAERKLVLSTKIEDLVLENTPDFLIFIGKFRSQI